MSSQENSTKTPYRWYAFTHWLNLAFVAGAGVAGAFIDPIFAIMAAPLELGALWVIPDLPFFRVRVDQIESAKDLARERAYYLQQLWGLGPPLRKTRPTTLGKRIAGWFVEVDDENVDQRVINRDAAFQKYLDMRDILAKLKQEGLDWAPNHMSTLSVGQAACLVPSDVSNIDRCLPADQAARTVSSMVATRRRSVGSLCSSRPGFREAE